ncbi:MAG: amidase, partial [Rhizobiaceae bacterium]|nr:amidase [Rhizobiaceae bacterium]
SVDDLLAARIRAAGAILIGKTNTPEFGLGSHSYNPVHGVTRNPYDTTKGAGGSSGGAAAALAARLVPVADGSDTMGSLRNPAAFCNVYGFRPSFGLVPRDPAGEVFLNQISTDGPMARDIRDLALLLDILAGPAAHDPHSQPRQGSLAQGLGQPSARGLRIGWIGDWDGYLAMEPEILTLCERALRVLAETGATVEPLVPAFDPASLWSAWLTLRSFHNAGSKRNLYVDRATRRLLKPELIYEIESGLAVDAMALHEASVARSAFFFTMAELFQAYDAVVLPSAQVFPFAAEQDWPKTIGDRPMDTYHRWMEVVVPASILGLPALNVPVGFSTSGLPMGMQLIGPRGTDLAILRLGQAYHEATDWPGRYPPRVAPSSVAKAP